MLIFEHVFFSFSQYLINQTKHKRCCQYIHTKQRVPLHTYLYTYITVWTHNYKHKNIITHTFFYIYIYIYRERERERERESTCMYFHSMHALYGVWEINGNNETKNKYKTKRCTLPHNCLSELRYDTHISHSFFFLIMFFFFCSFNVFTVTKPRVLVKKAKGSKKRRIRRIRVVKKIKTLSAAYCLVWEFKPMLMPSLFSSTLLSF